jgi:uncharacterized protein (DUF305 family)
MQLLSTTALGRAASRALIWAAVVGSIALTTTGLTACSFDSSDSKEMNLSESENSTMNHGTGTMDMTDMDLGPADASFDLRFIDAMIPHHQGAVVMAQAALEKSQRPEVKQLAQGMIAAQQQEIQQMQAWRQAWYADAEEPMMYDAQMGHMMPMTEEYRSSMMMSADLGAAGEQFDLRFINMMIPHHEGAVTMAQAALAKSQRPEIRALAQEIIDSQQQEIDQMKQWKQQWYGG